MTANRVTRILCPTDFSPISTQALRHAAGLARKFGAQLKCVYVIPHLYPGGEAMYGVAPWLMTPEVRQRAEEEMRRFLEPLREARLTHEIEIREGDPWREITAVAEEMAADLVVLGTHGRGGLDHYILGSVAEKVIRRVPCPVLSVAHEEGRTWAAPGLIGRILCSTDFSGPSTEALAMAVTIAEKYQAEMTVLHVIENAPESGEYPYLSVPDVWPPRKELEREASEHLRLALDAVKAPTERIDTRVAFGRAYKEILKAAALDRSDLIVIGAQGHGFIEHLLSGSNAQHVIRAATCPVLTVRPLGPTRRVEAGPHGLTLASTQGPASEGGQR